MKYKVGDIVKVRDDLEVGKCYGGSVFSDYMGKFKGKIITIKKRLPNKYFIEEDDDYYEWYWTDEMFEDNNTKTYKISQPLEILKNLNIIEGIVSDANYEYKKIVKINPTALHYENDGEEPYIKYVCPICQSLGVRLQLTKGKANCTICNVNLNWEE